MRIMRICLVFIAISALFLSFSLNAKACSFSISENQTVNEGEGAIYYVNVTNNDHPLGVQVRVEFSQDIGDHATENDEFYLDYLERGVCRLLVFTEGVEADEIITDCTIYEKGEEESDYHGIGGGSSKTTILHSGDDTPATRSSDEQESNIFALATGGFSIMVIVLSAVHYGKYGTLPIIGNYTKLKKGDLLENKGRKEIYNIINQCDCGICFTDLLRESGFSHKSRLHYHLRCLKKFGYVRRSGKLYYPWGVSVQKSFIEQIQEARGRGYQTPTEVAREIDSYPEKVRYHMEKHGLWERKKN